MSETCRDVLGAMLAASSNQADFDHLLDVCGFPPDRLRAAIAADDAERERLRRIEDAARQVDEALGSLMRAGCGIVAHNAPPEVGAAIARALASLAVAILPPTMRQLDAAQKLAAEMPEARRAHARMAVDGGSDGD